MDREAKKMQQNRVATIDARKNLLEDDIPERLRDLVGRKLVKTRGSNNGGLAKSWNIYPKSCNNVEKSSCLPQLYYSNRDLKMWYHRGWGYLPHWETRTPLKHMVWSNAPDNFVTVGVTGVSRPLFMFYKQTCPWYTRCRLGRRRFELRHDPNAHKWVKYDSTLVDPNSSSRQYMQLGNIVVLSGKFYALSLQGTLVVIEEVDSSMIITRVSSSRAVPSISSRHFKEYLVESDGEIWLIFLLFTKLSNSVDAIEIFRLQMENIAWKKLERLGKDRAVFVGTNCCWIVTASEVGCRGNCIYFNSRGVDDWWVYDMGRGDTSPCSSSTDMFGSGSTDTKVA